MRKRCTIYDPYVNFFIWDLPETDANSPLIAFKISRCEFLHKPVNFLGFSRKSKALQKHPQCGNKVFALEIHLIYVGIHHFFIEPVIIPEELSHLSLRKEMCVSLN